MRMEDLFLVRFLWHFESLRQSNQREKIKSVDLGCNSTSPATGDSQTAIKPSSIHHEVEFKQVDVILPQRRLSSIKKIISTICSGV
jgi:hypothetical protein